MKMLLAGKVEIAKLEVYNLSAGYFGCQGKGAGIMFDLPGVHGPVPTKKIIGDASRHNLLQLQEFFSSNNLRARYKQAALADLGAGQHSLKLCI